MFITVLTTTVFHPVMHSRIMSWGHSYLELPSALLGSSGPRWAARQLPSPPTLTLPGLGEGAPTGEVKGHLAERPELGKAPVQAAHGEESSRLTEQGGVSAGHSQQHSLQPSAESLSQAARGVNSAGEGCRRWGLGGHGVDFWKLKSLKRHREG